MELSEKLSNLIDEINTIDTDISFEIDSIKSSKIIEIKKLQREIKELKAKVSYLELNKEGIERKDDILFKKNEEIKEQIVSLNKKILNYGYGKNAIDTQETNVLIKNNEKLKRKLHNTTTALNATNESIKLQKDLLKEEQLLNKILKIKVENFKSKLDNYPTIINQLNQSNYEKNRLQSVNNEIKEFVKNQKVMYSFSKYCPYEAYYIISILDEISSILD